MNVRYVYLCHLDSGPEPSVRLYQPGPAYRCELAGREDESAGRTITLAGLAPGEGHGRPGKHSLSFTFTNSDGPIFYRSGFSDPDTG